VCGERNTRKIVLSAVHDVVRYIEQQGEVRVGLLGLNKRLARQACIRRLVLASR